MNAFFLLEQIIGLRNRRKAPVRDVYLIRVVFGFAYLVRVAEHCCLAVVPLHLLRIGELVHADSLPPIVGPEDLVQGAEQHANVVFHWWTADPVVYFDFMAQVSLVPLSFLLLLLSEIAFHVVNPRLLSRHWLTHLTSLSLGRILLRRVAWHLCGRRSEV